MLTSRVARTTARSRRREGTRKEERDRKRTREREGGGGGVSRRDDEYQYGESVKSNAPALRSPVRELARRQCVRAFDAVDNARYLFFSFSLIFFLNYFFARNNIRFVEHNISTCNFGEPEVFVFEFFRDALRSYRITDIPSCRSFRLPSFFLVPQSPES